MSGTALDNPLVREYLAALDAAIRGLPAAQARELKEQITAHLDDALPPDADDQAVTDALRRLGSPADLAAEAGAARGEAGPATVASTGPAATARALRLLMLSVRPRTWIAVAVLAIAVATAARIADHYLSASPLQFSSGGDWWYAQDAHREDIVRTNAATQNSAPIRSGQYQGYVVSVLNLTNVTQTIVGDASGASGWNSPGSGVERLTVSRTYIDIANGLVGRQVAHALTFTLPVSIPPFQSRLVRVLWRSDLCMSPGEGNSIDTLALRVRVGWFTRTEIIPQQSWTLIGPSRGRCR
jgi:hypothetical protein